jgi:hypothetical protein
MAEPITVLAVDDQPQNLRLLGAEEAAQPVDPLQVLHRRFHTRLQFRELVARVASLARVKRYHDTINREAECHSGSSCAYCCCCASHGCG